MEPRFCVFWFFMFLALLFLSLSMTLIYTKPFMHNDDRGCLHIITFLISLVSFVVAGMCLIPR
jgi:hypothetical protein